MSNAVAATNAATVTAVTIANRNNQSSSEQSVEADVDAGYKILHTALVQTCWIMGSITTILALIIGAVFIF